MGIEMEWNQFLFKELTQIYEEITLQVHFYAQVFSKDSAAGLQIGTD